MRFLEGSEIPEPPRLGMSAAVWSGWWHTVAGFFTVGSFLDRPKSAAQGFLCFAGGGVSADECAHGGGRQDVAAGRRMAGLLKKVELEPCSKPWLAIPVVQALQLLSFAAAGQLPAGLIRS